MNINRAPVQNPISDQARAVVVEMLKKNGKNISQANEKFLDGVNTRLGKGNVPNPMLGEVMDLFSVLTTIESDLEKLLSAQDVIGPKVFGNLTYDKSLQANELLKDSVFELPDIEGMRPDEEVVEYEQSLIKLFNELPNVRDTEKRQNLIWVSSILSENLENLKVGR